MYIAVLILFLLLLKRAYLISVTNKTVCRYKSPIKS